MVADIIRNYTNEGDADAHNTLDTLYRSGLGLSKNEAVAFQWYRKATEQGIPDAQYTPGLMCSSGSGVTKNNHIDIDWIFRAAQQGHNIAKHTFDIMMSDDVEIGYQAKLLHDTVINVDLTLSSKPGASTVENNTGQSE